MSNLTLKQRQRPTPDQRRIMDAENDEGLWLDVLIACAVLFVAGWLCGLAGIGSLYVLGWLS